MVEMIKLTLRLPGDVHRRLKKRATATQQSLNQVMVDALRRGLEQPPVEESERERTIRALKEAGLYQPLGPEWNELISKAPDITPKEMRERLKGLPPLSEIIIEDRGPR